MSKMNELTRINYMNTQTHTGQHSLRYKYATIRTIHRGEMSGGKYPRGEMSGGKCPGGKCPDTVIWLFVKRLSQEAIQRRSQRDRLVKIKVFKLRRDPDDIPCNITLRSAEESHSIVQDPPQQRPDSGINVVCIVSDGRNVSKTITMR